MQWTQLVAILLSLTKLLNNPRKTKVDVCVVVNLLTVMINRWRGSRRGSSSASCCCCRYSETVSVDKQMILTDKSLSSLSVNGQYVPQGKLGCAVLAQHTSRNVRLCSALSINSLSPLLVSAAVVCFKPEASRYCQD